MAGETNVAAMKDALVVLGAASVLVPVIRTFNVSPIIAFFLVGMALGPNGLGALAEIVPGLSWITIHDLHTIEGTAELGVVFLLFVIGLELSLARLLTMRRLVFGLGLAQVVVTTAVIALAARQVLPTGAALVVASGLALSSTAIVIEVLAAQKRVASNTGRVSFSILLFQDLAVVPILFLVGTLAEPSRYIMVDLGLALFKAAVTIGLIVVAGQFLLRPLFRLVASPDSPEFFMAATLLVAIGTGVVAAAAGLSMALGAFIAGLLLAETEYRRAIEATIEPFKSLLLGVFFFAVGMSLDLSLVVANLPLVLAALVALLALKGLIVVGLARIFRLSTAVALETAFLLAPAGEFAFVVLALAASKNILTPDQAALTVAVASLSMALVPLLGLAGRRIAQRFEAPAAIEAEAAVLPPADHASRAVVVGYGRVGRLVCDMLERHQISHIAVDADARGVARWRRHGRNVYWGDATNAAFLERCGLQEAAALVVTIDQPKQVEAIVAAARSLMPDLVIVARSRDAEHARALYGLGVTDAVPETIEASLQLSEAALAGLGVPAGPVIASIHERRDEFRRELQTAAGRPTLAVRRPRRKAAGSKAE